MPLPTPTIDLDVFNNPQLMRTDTGNADLLVEAFGRCCIRWTKAAGWFWFNGKHWERDALDRVKECAKITMRWLHDNGPTAEWREWGRTSQSSARINSLINLAQSHPEVATRVENFDDEPWLFCVDNGVLDLRALVDGKGDILLPHQPDFLITKISPVEYCPELGADGLLLEVLDQVLPEEVWKYLLRCYGYALAGDPVDAVLPILYGKGQNGKSVIQESVAWLFGGYAVVANEDLLIEKKNNEHPTEMARLFGSRLVTCSETGETARLNEKRVKKLVDDKNHKVAGRFMNKDYFEFGISWLLTVDTNHKPVIRGGDDGIWRRVSVIPFTYRVPDEKKDDQLGSKLRDVEEGSKTLNLILLGLRDWHNDGFNPPPAVRAANANYRGEMDDVGRFIKECCETGVDLDKSSPSVNIYEMFCKWAQTENVTPVSETLFGRKLTSLGFPNYRHKSGNRRDVTVREGLRLLVS